MERIEGQVVDSQELAKQALGWITCSKRPLTTLELQHALAVEIGRSSLDEENLSEIEEVVSVCAGLVTIDEESGIIRLVHYTTQEYFERTWISWFPHAQDDIAKTCATYLLFSAFQSGTCDTDHEFDVRLESNPLYDYAARNWAYYAGAASTEPEELILEFLQNDAAVSASNQGMMALHGYGRLTYSHYGPREMRGEHLAAYFGLEKAMTALLKRGHNPDSRDSNSWTPLSWAARSGHGSLVTLLLATAAVDVNSSDSKGWTPLLLAVEQNRKNVVKLLLATAGVDVNWKNMHSKTPLSLAVDHRHIEIAKLLLATASIDVNSKDHYRETPLFGAIYNRDTEMVELLLTAAGINVHCKNLAGETPLFIASGQGDEKIAELLLATAGVDVNSKYTSGETLLSKAAWNGRDAVVELLLAIPGVDANSKNDKNETPLSLAAWQGEEKIVGLLLATAGVDVNCENSGGETPLSIATSRNHQGIAKLLKSRGARTGK